MFELTEQEFEETEQAERQKHDDKLKELRDIQSKAEKEIKER